jgi:chromosomal replication initiator protein
MPAMPITDYTELWQQAVQKLSDSFNAEDNALGAQILGNIQYSHIEGDTISATVSNAFFADQIKRTCLKTLKETLAELCGENIEVQIVVGGNVAETRSAPKVTAAPEPKARSTKVAPRIDKMQNTDSDTVAADAAHERASDPVKKPFPHSAFPARSGTAAHTELNADFTLDTFVPGNNSLYAYNAALAVSQNPGRAYNPLLIYGGVGLGKTHLMQAIGNALSANFSGKILYITTETFVNEYIQSLPIKAMPQFRNKYRSADVLLIDDIHFFQNKAQTQDEMFYTFEELYKAKKQMVFTCDRPISELRDLPERLKSRFTSGLTVDLLPPPYETRRAIIEKKLELTKKILSAEVINLIAMRVETNVRDVEAAINKITGYAELVDKEVTVEKAQELLHGFAAEPVGSANVDDIQKIVAAHFNITAADIRGRKRQKNIVNARHIAVYIARELTEYSYVELGSYFGGKDHSTIIHSISVIQEAIKLDPQMENTVTKLIRDVKEYRKQ